MKTEADRVAVKHSDVIEDLLSKHGKELEDAGSSAPFWRPLFLRHGVKRRSGQKKIAGGEDVENGDGKGHFPPQPIMWSAGGALWSSEVDRNRTKTVSVRRRFQKTLRKRFIRATIRSDTTRHAYTAYVSKKTSICMQPLEVRAKQLLLFLQTGHIAAAAKH